MEGAQASCLRFTGIPAGHAHSLSRAVPYLTPLLPAQNFLVRPLRYLCDLLGFGLNFARALHLLIVMVLMHLGLMLLKIGFVNSRCSDLKRFDVACPALHYVSFLVKQTVECAGRAKRRRRFGLEFRLQAVSSNRTA